MRNHCAEISAASLTGASEESEDADAGLGADAAPTQPAQQLARRVHFGDQPATVAAAARLPPVEEEQQLVAAVEDGSVAAAAPLEPENLPPQQAAQGVAATGRKRRHDGEGSQGSQGSSPRNSQGNSQGNSQDEAMSSAPAPPPAPSRMSSAEGQRVGGVSESEEARDESHVPSKLPTPENTQLGGEQTGEPGQTQCATGAAEPEADADAEESPCFGALKGDGADATRDGSLEETPMDEDAPAEEMGAGAETQIYDGDEDAEEEAEATGGEAAETEEGDAEEGDAEEGDADAAVDQTQMGGGVNAGSPSMDLAMPTPPPDGALLDGETQAYDDGEEEEQPPGQAVELE